MVDEDYATKFVGMVSEALNSKRGALVTYNSRYIGKDRVFGEFYISDGSPIINIAIKHSLEDWLGVLVHEFAHFRQWSTQSKDWSRVENCGECGGCEKEEYINRIIDLEYDADKRALDMIKKYQLPIDIQQYCRKSNLIMYKWLHYARYKAWPATSITTFKKLTLACPDYLLRADSIPKNLATTLLHVQQRAQSLTD